MRSPAMSAVLTTTNPATEEALASYQVMGPVELSLVLGRSDRAFQAWRHSTFEERAGVLRAASARLLENVEAFAYLITEEMGKPLAEARAEVEKCAWGCNYYADNGPEFLTRSPVDTSGSKSWVEFAPLGPVLAIMPWNYPFWQVMRFAAPTLMAGNSIVLKHAANVTGCALALERLFSETGLPDDTFQTIVAPGPAASGLIDDPRIAAVTLTGSEEVGTLVASRAGLHLKKAVLELGGSDAFVVLGDADLQRAATTAARARFQNAGQSCIAAKRFIVHTDIYAEFEQRFVEATAQLRVGDPKHPDTTMGPMARRDLRIELEEQVARGLDAGGRIVFRGARPTDTGAYFAPTIVGDVKPGNPLFTEETFGPVAALVRAADDEAALRLANSSSFGLGCSIWTGDPEKIASKASVIEAGSVTINAMTASDPRMPFGGVKRSGFGRELGIFGIREFVNVQAVSVAA